MFGAANAYVAVAHACCGVRGAHRTWQRDARVVVRSHNTVGGLRGVCVSVMLRYVTRRGTTSLSTDQSRCHCSHGRAACCWDHTSAWALDSGPRSLYAIIFVRAPCAILSVHALVSCWVWIIALCSIATHKGRFPVNLSRVVVTATAVASAWHIVETAGIEPVVWVSARRVCGVMVVQRPFAWCLSNDLSCHNRRALSRLVICRWGC